MILLVLALLAILFAGSYVLAMTGRLDAVPAVWLLRLRLATIILVLLLGLWAAWLGAIAILPLTAFLGVPILRYLLNPERDRITAEHVTAIRVAMTRAEALRLLELDEDEAAPAPIEAAYRRLIALVAPAARARSYYAVKVQAARDFLLPGA